MNDIIDDNSTVKETQTNVKDARKLKFVWVNVIFMVTTNITAVYGIYLCFTKATWSTILFAYFLSIISNIGVTAGAHRLWSHRSYKVKLPLNIIYILMFTLAYQGTVYQWVRDHRSHHKYCDTDADPHNSKRGFFFSHMGWLMVKKHPDVINKGRSIDMSDIESDPLLRLQRKYYFLLLFIISFGIPAYVPLLWGEDLWTSFIVAVVLRHAHALHMIFFVNSAAHIWGYKPYDKNACAVENKTVSYFASGEGFHNYHHTFPWDYKTSELGEYVCNISLVFIDMMAKIGWAYDLKTVSKKLIETRVVRSGDGTHPIWGWNDKDLPPEYKQSAKIL